MSELKGMLQQARKTLCIPVHPAGWPFIAGFAVVSIFLAMASEFLGLVGLVLTVWCVYFFRNPHRHVPQRKGLLVSPADGVVSMITTAPLPAEIDVPENTEDKLFSTPNLTRISIFLNVFDVHVNRNPVKGTVEQLIYHPGKFLNAELDKASLDNERNTLVVKADGYDTSIAFVQIAGFVARPILCDTRKDDTLLTGERYGMIRFGSRVDIYLPPGVEPLVSVGQKMIGGETVIADLESSEPRREAVIV